MLFYCLVSTAKDRPQTSPQENPKLCLPSSPRVYPGLVVNLNCQDDQSTNGYSWHKKYLLCCQVFPLSSLLQAQTGTLLNHCCTTANEQMENLPNFKALHLQSCQYFVLSFHNPYYYMQLLFTIKS